jgi:hypothetical protein
MTKKRQHYVWQHYINNWANTKNQVFVVASSNQFYSNSENLAVERYFYNLEYFSESDVDFIKKLYDINENGNELQKQNMKWIDSFSQIFRLKDSFDKSGISTEEGNKLFLQGLKDVEEDGISMLENDFLPLLKKLMQKEVNEFSIDKNYFDLVFFLCFTYFRTKKIRDRAIESVKGTKLGDAISDVIRRTWSFSKYILTTNLTFGIVSSKFNIVFLENNTNVKFISSDQPVINTRANYSIPDKVDDLELYFPVTPEIGLLLTKDKTEETVFLRSLNQEEVKMYNQLIIDSYEEQLYFTDKIQKDLVLGV